MDPPLPNDFSSSIIFFGDALAATFSWPKPMGKTFMVKARDFGHPGATFYLQHERTTLIDFFFAIRDMEDDEGGWSLFFQAYYLWQVEDEGDEALRLFALSAERHKNGQAAWEIAWDSRDSDPSESYKYCLMAADFGYAAAAHYGLYHHYERHMHDLEKAFFHLSEAAKLGYCYAYQSLSRFYDNGLGGAPKDHSKGDYYATIPSVNSQPDIFGSRKYRLEYLYEHFLEKQHSIYPFVTSVCKTSPLWNAEQMIFLRNQVGEWTRQARQRVFIWLMIYKRMRIAYFPRDVALHIAQLIWEERKRRK